MAVTKVICPVHGVIKEIEMACMWKGRPPMPEIDDAFCPLCGSKTVIKRGKDMNVVYSWSCKDEEKFNRRKGRSVDISDIIGDVNDR